MSHIVDSPKITKSLLSRSIIHNKLDFVINRILYLTTTINLLSRRRQLHDTCLNSNELLIFSVVFFC